MQSQAYVSLMPAKPMFKHGFVTKLIVPNRAGSLQDISNGFPPQYGALVFDDDVGSEIARAAFGGFGAAYNASALDLHGGQAADVVYSLLGATPQGR